MPKVKDLGVTVVPEQFGPMEIGPGGACNPTQFCTDCTMQQFSICGTTPGPGTGCSDCTFQQFSICGTSPGPQFCTDCTYRPFSLCGGATPGPACRFGTNNPWTPCGGTWETPCGGSWTDPWRGRGITPDAIAQMKQQLQAQIAALEEVEKAAAPKTLAAIEAREKELQGELDRLKASRTELSKKK